MGLNTHAVDDGSVYYYLLIIIIIKSLITYVQHVY